MNTEQSVRSARELGYCRKRSNKFSDITLTSRVQRHLEMNMLQVRCCLIDAVTRFGFRVASVKN
jgi:hypothetical protein